MSTSKPETIAGFAPRLGWRGAVANFRFKNSDSSQSLIFGGSLIMLMGSGMVSIVNFAYNVVMARMLGPADFGHNSAAATILMLASAITLAFQLVCAKFVARNESPGAKSLVYSTLMRRAWMIGLCLGLSLLLGSAPISRYLRLPTPWIVVLLGLGLTFYVPLGVKRGGLQGSYAFPRLSGNFVLEAVTKFIAAVLLVRYGFGVPGAVAGYSIALMLAFFLPPVSSQLKTRPQAGVPASFREGMQAIVFFVGQVVINNIDILLVKHFFAPEPAGLYAAVALVGRVLYITSWSVVSAMFPISAGAKHEEERTMVLGVPLAFVVAISVAFVAGLQLFPETVLVAVFGSGFRQAGQGIGPLLSLYAATTGVYSLSVVLMTYEMSRRIANTGWLQLVFSGLVIIGITVYHASLRDVIMVQLVLMAVMLVAVSLPFFTRRNRTRVLPEAA